MSRLEEMLNDLEEKGFIIELNNSSYKKWTLSAGNPYLRDSFHFMADTLTEAVAKLYKKVAGNE